MKNLKKLILAGIALVVLLAAGAYVAVKLAFPPNKIRELIRTKGTAAMGRGVDVGEIRVRLFPIIKITVSEVNVANAPGFSAEPLIKLRELDLSVSFLSLLRFSPVIQQIKIISPEILYEVDARGHNNLEGLGGKKSEADTAKTTGPIEIPAAVALRSFVILDGKVRYRDAQTGRELILGLINQEVSLALDPRLQDIVSQGHLEISELSVRDSASGLRKGGVRITLTHDVRMDLPGERLQIKKVEFGFQDIRVQLEGSIAHFITSKPETDIRVSAPAISLASVLKEVPANLSPEIPKLKAEGTASFQAHLMGVLDSTSKPEVEASVQVHGGTLSHSDLPAGIKELEMDVLLRHDSLRLARLSFDMGGNPVNVEALVTDLRKIPQLRQLLVNAVLDLGNLAALAQRMGMLEKNITVSGTESVKLQASGALDPAHPEKLSAAGTVELKGVSIALPGKPVLRCDGRMDINNDRIVENLVVKIGQSDVAVKAEVSNYLALVLPRLAKGGRAKVKADIRSANLDLDEWMPPPAPAAADEKSPPPLTAYPPLPPVDADITTDLARTHFMGLEMTRFKSLTTARADGIKTDVKGSVYSGSFASTVNLKPKSSTDMGVDVKVNALRVEANDFISRLNDRVPGKTLLMRSVANADNLIFGKLNLNMDMATHGLPQDFVKNLGGALLFSIADGKLMESGLTKGLSGALSKVNSSLGFNQLAFGGMQGDFKVEDGKLEIRDFHLDNSPLGALQLAGKVGFDNALELQLTEALPAGVSKLVAGPSGALAGQLSKLAPIPGVANASLVPTDKSGRALLFFAVGGLLTNPSFVLDVKRMAREGAAGSAKAALAGALDQKKDELKAKAQAEKERLEAEARARIEAEKSKAVDGAKSKGRKVLKGLGL